MTDKDEKKLSQTAASREKRRAEQLRANLMRRKTQARSRRAGDADERNDGIVAKSTTENNSD